MCRSHPRCHSPATRRAHPPTHLHTSPTAPPPLPPPCLPAPPVQMTHANVGSLLVFDPSKMHLVRTKDGHITNVSKDAVLGIITERGE